MATRNGKWTDLVEEFMEYTRNRRSPEIYRLWSAITMIGGACERRVWAVMGDHTTYPNLYTLLVGPPGTGKSVIQDVSSMWEETKKPDSSKAFTMCPRSVTRASLVDALAAASKTIVLSNPLKANPGKPNTYTYHSLQVASPEFEVIMPEYNSDMIGLLNDLWDSDLYTETRRHGPQKETKIDRPYLNILGGVQPAYFTAHFPDYAWSTGLSRRFVMIYSHLGVKLTAEQRWTKSSTDNDRSHIMVRLGQIATMYGQLMWSPEAKIALDAWIDGGEKPMPTHPKLEFYNSTRQHMLTKLAIISAVSRAGPDAVIEEEDIRRGLYQWLIPAEMKMPDVFRAMQGRSDGQILNELHLYILSKHQKDKKCVSFEEVTRFMSVQAPAEKIAGIVNLAQSSGMIVRSNDGWLPGRRNLNIFDA